MRINWAKQQQPETSVRKQANTIHGGIKFLLHSVLYVSVLHQQEMTALILQ